MDFVANTTSILCWSANCKLLQHTSNDGGWWCRNKSDDTNSYAL